MRHICSPLRLWTNPTTRACEKSGRKLVEKGGVKLSIHRSCGIRRAAHGSRA